MPPALLSRLCRSKVCHRFARQETLLLQTVRTQGLPCCAQHSRAETLEGEPIFHSRRQLLSSALILLCATPVSAQAARSPIDSTLVAAFQEAMAVEGDFEAKDDAWGKVIALAPGNSAAWSNRGTIRLQYGRWEDAYSDLQHAYGLELKTDRVSSILLNNLGNTEGALGRWEQAMEHYRAAAEDPEMESIARANLALAAFELEQSQEAVREARQLLRRDPGFLDMRAALAAFLWAQGDGAAAEGEWEALQEAEDGLGGVLYSPATAVSRVQNRWPPRATAALMAFLALSDTAEAQGYDMATHKYHFSAAAAS